jgi:hypothetical protein
LVRICILNVQRSIIFGLFSRAYGYSIYLLLSFGLAGFFLERLRWWLSGSVSVVGDRRDGTVAFLLILVFILVLSYCLLTSSASQPFDFLVDDLSIIVVLPFDGFLFPLLEAADLDGDALQPIDLFFDLPSQIVVFVLDCFLFLHLELLDAVHGSGVDVKV